MNYHFQRKYNNRKDISLLVVEKTLNPFEREDYRHDIGNIASFLNGYGFSVDLVWSLGNYKFNNFEDFLVSIVSKFDKEIRRYLENKDELRELIAEYSKKELNEFKNRNKLLRKKPINSIEDLADYDFLIMHLDFDDCEKVLPKILEIYSDKPIILPMDSVAAATHQSYANNFAIEDVKKDPKYPSVYIIDTNFDVQTAVLTLIEYLLDEKEKVSSQEKQEQKEI